MQAFLLIALVVMAGCIGGESQAVVEEAEPNLTPPTEGKVATFSREEVAKHNSPESCWLIIDGKVYDVTAFVPEHPGGEEILEYCGRDATESFYGVEEHMEGAVELKEEFFIGFVRE